MSAHFGETYLYGEDDEIDQLHEARWALVIDHFPQPKPSPDATEEELREQWNEHERRTWELQQDIAQLRDAMSYRKERKQRPTRRPKLR